jgi:hypothetical protein
VEIGGELAGQDEELVVGHFRKRDGAACGNEMGTLLEDEACVPRNHEKSERSRGRESEGCSLQWERMRNVLFHTS